MTVHYATKAFIFKKEDRLEADRIFTVFSQDFGRTEIFAKAIRKIASKLKSGVEIFFLSELEFIQGKNRKTLTDARVLEPSKNIWRNPEKLLIAHTVAKTLDIFIKGQQPDEKIWNLIIDFFKKLDSSFLPAENYPLAGYYFLWNFFSSLGYHPELFQCAICRGALNPDALFFSHKEGGVVCDTCRPSLKSAEKINSDTVKVLRLFLKNDWQTFSKLKISQESQRLIEEISKNYSNYLLHSYFLKDHLLVYPIHAF